MSYSLANADVLKRRCYPLGGKRKLHEGSVNHRPPSQLVRLSGRTTGKVEVQSNQSPASNTLSGRKHRLPRSKSADINTHDWLLTPWLKFGLVLQVVSFQNDNRLGSSVG